MLAARDGELVQIDLDDAAFAADNAATVRAFWEQAAPGLGLGVRFIAEAVERADGNLQHAATLRKHLAGLPAARRRVEDIPRGLAALLERTWQRVATEPIAARGLGILCAAREALTLDELGAVAGWADEAERQAFVRGARELLVETPRPEEPLVGLPAGRSTAAPDGWSTAQPGTQLDVWPHLPPAGQAEYRLHHDSIRAHVAKTIGPAALRAQHGALAQRLAVWPPPAEPTARRYALRHALLHRIEAGDWAGAWRLAADTSFLEAKCREFGAHETEADLAHAAERCRASGDESLRGRFEDLARALGRESHWRRAGGDGGARLEPAAPARLERRRDRSSDEAASRGELPARAARGHAREPRACA
jgi:hypothetical protein